jgi:hypothetical protein
MPLADMPKIRNGEVNKGQDAKQGKREVAGGDVNPSKLLKRAVKFFA